MNGRVVAWLEAELVGRIYRYRWQSELFFKWTKWIKCILGCRHWLTESQEGMSIQIYCALDRFGADHLVNRRHAQRPAAQAV